MSTRKPRQVGRSGGRFATPTKDEERPSREELERKIGRLESARQRQEAELQADRLKAAADGNTARESAAQLAAVEASSSWRLTAPLRRLAAKLRRLTIYRWLRFRTHRMALQTVQDMAEPGDRQRFTLRSSKTAPPSGWVSLRFRWQPEQNPLSPVLEVDSGAGFNEAGTIRLGQATGGSFRTIARLPDSVLGLRFGPFEDRCNFRIRALRIREIGHFELTYRAAARCVGLSLADPRKSLRLARAAIKALRHRRLSALAEELLTLQAAEDEYAAWIAMYDRITPADRQAIARRLDELPYRPLISIIMPVYDPPVECLREALDSVVAQLYSGWELCVADDASTNPEIRDLLAAYAAREPRIKVVYRRENGHISAASNSALALATGEFLALLDHDDELSEHALYMVVEELNAHPDADLIFSDEDKLDDSGKRSNPYFKSDWNPDLFRSQNCISHLGVYRASLVGELGGFRVGYEGSQDYDLALRVIEKTSRERIRHIPHVLYHWRALPTSVASTTDAKSYATVAARKALSAHFDRCGQSVEVTAAPSSNFHRARYEIGPDPPLVSVIIPTRDRVRLLRRCVDGLLNGTDYPRFEVVLVDNQSEEDRTLRYLDDLRREPRVRVLSYEHPFNYSAINNWAVDRAKGEILCLLNNDTEVISRGWLGEMVSHALRPEVGMVGAKLYYPSDTIQHAGVLLGPGGVANHLHKNLPRSTPGYFSRAGLIQDLSAVTAACLVMRKEVFEEAGGLDSENLVIAFNDVDLCLRVRELGYWVVWTPHAELYHHESQSVGAVGPERLEQFSREVEYMRRSWGPEVLDNDPFYNPNLNLDLDRDFRLAFPTRARRPWLA